MKVVAKVRVLDRILEDIRKLQRDHREVDYVVVTPAEYDELLSDLRCAHLMQYPFSYLKAGDAGSKATVTTRDFELQAANPERARFVRTFPQGSIYGADIYVVPKEYHPR